MKTNGLARHRGVIEDARRTDQHWASEVVRDITPRQQEQLLDAMVTGFGLARTLTLLGRVVRKARVVAR